MPWVRLSDDFTTHPKLVRVGPIGVALQVRMLCHCSRHLTDGHFSFGELMAVCADIQAIDYETSQGHTDTVAKSAAKWLDVMLGAGIWEDLGNDDFYIHDYPEYQPSKEYVLTQRQRKAKNVADFRNRVRNRVTNRTSNRAPVPDPVPTTTTTTLRAPRARATETEDFETFWRAYPKKVGKPKAQVAFVRAKGRYDGTVGFLVRVLDAIEHQRRSRQWLEDGGKYIPHPTTWLNRDGWEDLIEGAARHVMTSAEILGER